MVGELLACLAGVKAGHVHLCRVAGDPIHGRLSMQSRSVGLGWVSRNELYTSLTCKRTSNY